MSEFYRDKQQLLQKAVENIQEILRPNYRPYLKVFHVTADTRLTHTVFQAIFDSTKDKENLISKC